MNSFDTAIAISIILLFTIGCSALDTYNEKGHMSELDQQAFVVEGWKK